MRIEIYGHSDDCVEVTGEIGDEFYAEGEHLHFDDGTVVKCEYGSEGYSWKFTVVKAGKDLEVERVPGSYEEDGELDDKLILEGNFKSVEQWRGPSGPDREELIDKLGEFDWSDLEHPQLLAAWAATK